MRKRCVQNVGLGAPVPWELPLLVLDKDTENSDVATNRFAAV